MLERVGRQPRRGQRDRLDEQRLSRREMVHQRALRHPGALGDPPCRQRRVTLVCEHVDRGDDSP
jgi:hypothetical protein